MKRSFTVTVLLLAFLLSPLAAEAHIPLSSLVASPRKPCVVARAECVALPACLVLVAIVPIVADDGAEPVGGLLVPLGMYVREKSHSGASGNPLFQGREWDSHRQEYYFRYRTYIPEWGSFAGPDMNLGRGILGERHGMMSYVAFGNNPLEVRDPMGLLSEEEAEKYDKVLGLLGGTSFGGTAVGMKVLEELMRLRDKQIEVSPGRFGRVSQFHRAGKEVAGRLKMLEQEEGIREGVRFVDLVKLRYGKNEQTARRDARTAVYPQVPALYIPDMDVLLIDAEAASNPRILARRLAHEGIHVLQEKAVPGRPYAMGQEREAYIVQHLVGWDLSQRPYGKRIQIWGWVQQHYEGEATLQGSDFVSLAGFEEVERLAAACYESSSMVLMRFQRRQDQYLRALRLKELGIYLPSALELPNLENMYQEKWDE